MNKTELRKKYKDLRLKLTPDDIENLSLEIANKSLQLPIWDYQFYHIFLSIAEKKEVNTEYLLHILQGKDTEIVVPRTEMETDSLSHFLLTDSTAIVKNKWNIPEPKDGIQISPNKLEVVFIPLLAFDKDGHRIGYGKGFYDRFLSKCDPGVIKVGLSFFETENSFTNVYSSDIPLDYCVTPKNIYDFHT